MTAATRLTRRDKTEQQQMRKIIIYQVLTRLFGNQNGTRRENGTLDENGVGKMNDFSLTVLTRIRKLGVTHIWYTGVIRHATTTDYSAYGIPKQHPAVVKGRAGSPYAITDYYDIDPDIAVNVENRMREFHALIARTHGAGMKVVIDFVPNHVARQYKSLAKPAGTADLGEGDDTSKHFSPTNNFYYCPGTALEPQFDTVGSRGRYVEYPAKATGNDRFDSHPCANDWYETVKLNYGVDYCDAGGRSEHFNPIPDTWNKMTDILLFWAAKGVDAFRCDMAEMVPAPFWSWAIDKVKYRYPHIQFIGEVYNPALYRTYIAAGFDYLYDKVGMYDCVRGVICGARPAADITAQWQATDDIRQHTLYFLENHDEQRIASAFFAGDARKGLPALAVLALMRPNPFMLYAGQEFGEKGMDKEGFSGIDGRTTIFDYWRVASIYNGYFNRKGLTEAQKRIERAYGKVLTVAAAAGTGADDVDGADDLFYDLMYVNAPIGRHIYAFLRRTGHQTWLVVANFAGEAQDAPVNIPQHAFAYIGLCEGIYHAVDLLTDRTATLALRHDAPVIVNIPAYSAKVLDLRPKGTSPRSPRKR